MGMEMAGKWQQERWEEGRGNRLESCPGGRKGLKSWRGTGEVGMLGGGGKGGFRVPAPLSLAHLLCGQGPGSGAHPIPASSVIRSWVQHPGGGGTGSSCADEGVCPPAGHPVLGSWFVQAPGARPGGLQEPRAHPLSAIPEKSDSFRVDTHLFSAPNYFKNTSSPCSESIIPCHTLFCVAWLSSHWLFPGFSHGGRTLCTSPGV